MSDTWKGEGLIRIRPCENQPVLAGDAIVIAADQADRLGGTCRAGGEYQHHEQGAEFY